MKALVTGASSGIGKDIARELSKKGYDIIAVARDGNKLNELKEELETKVEVIAVDLSEVDACKLLYKTVKNKNIDILVNNAGFGDCGEFIRNRFRKRIKYDKHKYSSNAHFNKTIFARYGKKR